MGNGEMGEVGRKVLISRVHPLNHFILSSPVLHFLCCVITSVSFGLSEHNFSSLANGDNFMVLVRNDELLYGKVVKSPIMPAFHKSSLVLFLPLLFPRFHADGHLGDDDVTFP